MAESIDFRLRVIEDKLGIVLEQNEKKAKSLGNAISTAVGTLGGFVAAKALSNLSGVLTDVVSQSREFSRAIAEINSVLPVGTKLTKEQEKALAQLSERYGTTATAQAKGFFEVVSNGIEDTSQAARILAAANNAALSGLVELSTATQLITSSFNAYSSQGETAASITDTLVAVTQASGVKFEELSNTLGRVTNVAAQSGVTFGELGGTIAFLNQRSVTTEQAVTGLAGILGEVSKPSQQASDEAARLGISFNIAALKAKGLVPFLQEITDKTKGNVSSLRQLFGDQRAANAVIAIASSEFSKYSSVVDKVTKSQGEASRASKIVKESLDFKLNVLSSSFNSLAIEIGTTFVPVINNTASSFKLLQSLISKTPKSLDENRNKLNVLGLEYNSIIDRLAAYRKTQEGANSEAAKALEERLIGIRRERDEIRKSASTVAPDTENDKKAALARALAETDADSAIKQSRIDSLNQMQISKTEFEAFEAERELARRELQGTLNQQDIELFIANEQLKIDAKFAAEEQKALLIQDSLTRTQTLEAIAAKKSIDIEKSKINAETQLIRSQTAEKQRQLQIQGNYIQTAANLAGAFAKEGSKASFLIQKGAAAAAIYVQDAQARTAALASAMVASIGLPFGAREAYIASTTAKSNALITSNTALAASALAASSIKGFAGGGIVGATTGPDNRMATIRDGEMVLNAEDQKNLFNSIKSGSLGNGQIVLQIDGRNLAYAIRDQVRQGFKLE